MKWAGVLVGIIVGAFLLFSATTRISPADLTRTRFRVLEARIHQNVVQGRDVKSLDLKSLPEAIGKDNSTEDGWDNPIIMNVDGSTITLTSFGKDGKPGGSDQDADIGHRFSVSSPDSNP